MPLKTGCLDDLLGHLLRHAYLTGQRAFLEAYPDHSLTPLAYGAFELIRLNPGVTHKKVATQLNVATSVLTTALKTAIASGYIEQIRHEKDRRTVAYTLSLLGESWFNAIRGDIKHAEASLSQGLSHEEVIRLKELLAKLR